MNNNVASVAAAASPTGTAIHHKHDPSKDGNSSARATTAAS